MTLIMLPEPDEINYFMNIFLNAILFFEFFIKILALQERDIGKYDWQIRNLGEI